MFCYFTTHEHYQQGYQTLLKEVRTEKDGSYQLPGLEKGVCRVELYVPEEQQEKVFYHGFQPGDMGQKIANEIWDYEILLPGEEDSWLAAIPEISLEQERELNLGILKSEPEENVSKKTNNEIYAAENTEKIKISYDEGYEMNIEGKIIRFKLTTSPEENGTLVIKLPPFFELTSLPSSQTEYNVSADEETIEETDMLLGGEKRQVITFQYKKVTSDVDISFEMSQTETRGLTQAMIRAGENPDKIPLNIDITLYDKDKTLMETAQLEGTSKLSEPKELGFQGEYETGKEKVGYGQENRNYRDFWNKDENILYVDAYGNDLESSISEISVGQYHYPYTDIELMVPYDKNSKIKSFNDGDSYHRSEWEKIETETYNGVSYLVGSLNDKNYEGYNADYVGEVFREYDLGCTENLMYTRLIFSDLVEPEETVSFEHPVLLRYTYKGKTVVKELYELADYTFLKECLPQILWTNTYGD